MSKLAPTPELIKRAAQVARSCPQEWSDFLAAFKAYSDSTKDQCVSSPVADFQVAQGRARECAALLRLFSECKQTADQIPEKRK